MKSHQRFMLKEQLDHIAHLESIIEDLDLEMARRNDPAKKVLERLRTIPGVGPRTAEVIVAEVGTDVSHFPSAHHLASWSGLAPGQNESAGKRKPAKARPGNASLRAAMVEAARAASRTKDTYLAAQHQRLSRHLKGKKATVAVAHSMIVNILKKGTDYQELGGDYFTDRDRTAVERSAIKSLQRLGYEVTLQPHSAA